MPLPAARRPRARPAAKGIMCAWSSACLFAARSPRRARTPCCACAPWLLFCFRVPPASSGLWTCGSQLCALWRRPRLQIARHLHFSLPWAMRARAPLRPPARSCARRASAGGRSAMIGAHWRRDWARSGNSAAAAGPRRSVWGAKLGKGCACACACRCSPPPAAALGPWWVPRAGGSLTDYSAAGGASPGGCAACAAAPSLAEGALGGEPPRS